MEDESDAEVAVRKLDRVEFGRKGRRLRVEWTKQERDSLRSGGGKKPASNEKPSRTLFVINFDPYDTKSKDLEKHFEPHGNVANIRIRKNFAFIQFETQEEATKALEATNMSELLDRVITVEYALRDDDATNAPSFDRRGRDRYVTPERRGFNRRRSPSPYRKDRVSPEYRCGRDRSSPDCGRSRVRESPDYGRSKVRSSPSHGHGGRDRGIPNHRRGRDRGSPDHGRGRDGGSPDHGRGRDGGSPDHGRGRDGGSPDHGHGRGRGSPDQGRGRVRDAPYLIRGKERGGPDGGILDRRDRGSPGGRGNSLNGRISDSPENGHGISKAQSRGSPGNVRDENPAQGRYHSRSRSPRPRERSRS